MSIATKVKDIGLPWTGKAALYRLDPPINYEDRAVEFVVISGSAEPPGPPEVAVFEASPDGVVENIGAHLVKVRHTTDHIAALQQLGYVQ